MARTGSSKPLLWTWMLFGSVIALLGLFPGCDDAASTANEGGGSGEGGAGGAALPEPAPRLALNDVSVLVPLPDSADTPGYLGAASAGDRGELLPQAVYDEIPEFPAQTTQGLSYDLMRAVGIRFDGCHQGPAGCEAQIRIVMQPVHTATGASKDSALHLFYRIEEADLGELVTELRRLRELAPEVTDGPLDVHPALLAQGMEGPYGAALNETVLRFAGEQNLVRVTFFLRAPPTVEVWFFGGFERVDGELEVMDIEGLGQSNQQVIRPEVEGGFEYQVNPIESVPESERPMLSTAAMAEATAAEREAAYAAYLRLLNPMLVKADDVSCAGCHVASYVVHQAELSHGLKRSDFADLTFVAEAHDLTLRGGALEEPASLRAFGYLQRDPMISERVVNESAGVVDDLEARFPPQ